MQLPDLAKSRHSVGRNLWVFEWCTKYRNRMMRKFGNKNIVAAIIRQVAKRHNIRIIVLRVLMEHVHMIVSLPKGKNDVWAVKLLKGASARRIFQLKPNFLLRYPRRRFWSRGYYSHTVGVTDLETQVRYIENQELHHGALFRL